MLNHSITDIQQTLSRRRHCAAQRCIARAGVCALRCCAAVLLCLVAASAQADDVAAYLEERGLKQLLATYLEQKLEQVTGEERDEIVLRLANLYSELLESTNDPAQRESLEERGCRLLEQAPADSAAELRLALLRTAYRVAEQVAERHRLRLATPEELNNAQRTLAEITPQLNTMRAKLREDVEISKRRLMRAGGSNAATMNNAAERVNRLYAQCAFLNAWAIYYQSWLTSRRENLREAETLFAELMATDSLTPQPSDVSVDLRPNEAVARSILGMALCKSLTASAATAVAWIELLEHPSAFEPLRAQATAWKIVVYLEHHNFQRVRELMQQHQQSTGDAPPTAWLRLVAAHALEAQGTQRGAAELARDAVTQLAARGELQQVFDLAMRYGTQALGETGFALRYVQGVIEYQQAREAHGGDEPAVDRAHVELYAKAAQSLTAAMGERDASNYETAAAACRRLIAWCLYFQSRLVEAREAFEDAAAALYGDESAEALWMAIVCLDKLAETDPSASWTADLTALIDQYLALYPSSDRAPQLRLKRSTLMAEVSPEVVDDLLLVPPESEVYPVAQRHAAGVLYQLFRRASSAEDRQRYATQFLLVAEPLLGPAARQRDLSSAADTEAFIVRCRQVLEVALSDEVQRLTSAQLAFDALAAAQEAGVDLREYADEFDCRRVQERLLAGDAHGAAGVADALWSRHPESIWARIVVRSMFKRAYRQWKDAGPDNFHAARDDIDMTVRYGGRVLHEFRDSDDPLAEPGAPAYYAAVAEASMLLWQRTDNRERGEAALFLYQKLLTKYPRNALYLRSAALLTEKLDDPPQSLEYWRRLIAGSVLASDQWFEAKVHLLTILAQSDPDHAREVMHQHKLLNLEYGPEPWGSMLREIDAKLASPNDHPDNTNGAADEVATPPQTNPADDGGSGAP